MWMAGNRVFSSFSFIVEEEDFIFIRIGRKYARIKRREYRKY